MTNSKADKQFATAKRAARRAKVAVHAYREAVQIDRYDAVTALLSDLMHFCDRHPSYSGFEGALDDAQWTYQQDKLIKPLGRNFQL